MQAANYIARINPDFFGPFCGTVRFSVYCDHAIISLVASLLCVCGPTTIFFEITQIIIVSFKRIARRAFAHITKKCVEIVAPTIAHRNSTSTVAVVGLDRRIKTSRFRTRPYFMLMAHTKAMRAIVTARNFALETATALTRPASQSLSVYNALSPAVASAEPLSNRSPGSFDNCPPSKSLSREFNNPRHSYSYSLGGFKCHS